jgi:hypothetical protein
MIYKLTRIDANRIGYDEYDSKVVRAASEFEARSIANIHVGDEGCLWDDPACVKCEEVWPCGEAVEILGSYNAG